MIRDSITAEEADTDGDESLSESELQALTVAQLRAVAAELGYTLTKHKKAEIIAEILYQQRLAGAEEGYVLTGDNAVTEGKTYYGRSGSEGEYTFAEVEEPSADDIAGYYEAGTFWKTEDTAVDIEKTYYTRSNTEGNYEFTAVNSVSLDNIGTYYEAVEG